MVSPSSSGSFDSGEHPAPSLRMTIEIQKVEKTPNVDFFSWRGGDCAMMRSRGGGAARERRRRWRRACDAKLSELPPARGGGLTSRGARDHRNGEPCH